MQKRIIAGSRRSRLALIQTQSVIEEIKHFYPDVDIKVKTIVTSGDRDTSSRIEKIGVAVFVKELEKALLEGSIDIAIHSLKDVPAQVAEGLTLVATPRRLDPRDVLVAKATLEELAPGSRIGTSSLRRTAQLARLRPDLKTTNLRGNMDTRLNRVASGAVDGAIMAAAALLRLGLEDRITQYMPLEHFLPCAGQGALVIEARESDRELVQMLSRIKHVDTWQSIIAERAFIEYLGAGCHAPVAVLGNVSGTVLRLDGMVASPDGRKIVRSQVEGEYSHPVKVGVRLAKKILVLGANELLDRAK